MGESQESCLQAHREDSAGKETSSKPPGEDHDQDGHGGQRVDMANMVDSVDMANKVDMVDLMDKQYDPAQSLGLDKYSQPKKLSPYQFCSSHHHRCCQPDKPGVCHDHPDYTDYSSQVTPRKILGFASLITKRRGALTFFAIMMVVMIIDHHRHYHLHHISNQDTLSDASFRM